MIFTTKVNKIHLFTSQCADEYRYNTNNTIFRFVDNNNNKKNNKLKLLKCDILKYIICSVFFYLLTLYPR